MAGSSDQHHSFVVNTLTRVDIFRNLPGKMIDSIANNIEIVSFDPGENIITKGEEGDSMYVIFSGSVMVHDDDFLMITLKENEFFGEIALLTEMKRISSVTAATACRLGMIHRSDFYKVLEHFPAVTMDIMNALCMRILKQNETLIAFLKDRENELIRLVDDRTEELREAQRQQFLQEKMASLGQLSSGIAHEIKNPLNFVNNFSLLSMDLLKEVEEEQDENIKSEILNDVKGNIQKIIEHGKRADSILNKLTQINEQNAGTVSSIDINTLCIEVVTKMYARYRSEYPDFTCGITMELSKDVPEISVPKEDLSRSIGFMLINAFESMHEKYGKSDETYRPELSVESNLDGEKINILIIDNGMGIKEEYSGQIFLPFFTTKPSRKNTGVGLTLSDNIIRGMKGRINITPSWKNGARFVVTLPAGRN